MGKGGEGESPATWETPGWCSATLLRAFGKPPAPRPYIASRQRDAAQARCLAREDGQLLEPAGGLQPSEALGDQRLQPYCTRRCAVTLENLHAANQLAG